MLNLNTLTNNLLFKLSTDKKYLKKYATNLNELFILNFSL